jgi:hypothetical protein
MSKYHALPTYVVTRLMLPLCKKEHPWRRGKFYSLQQWHDGQSDLARHFDVGLALCGCALVIAVCSMITVWRWP